MQCPKYRDIEITNAACIINVIDTYYHIYINIRKKNEAIGWELIK
jgi:hypothetical protein